MINVELMVWLEVVVLVVYWGEENVLIVKYVIGYLIFFMKIYFMRFFKKVFIFYVYKSVYIYVYNYLMIKLRYLVC